MTEYLAHKDKERDRQQLLKVHIRDVMQLAGAEGKKIGTGQIMELIGLFHDLGKYGVAFQEYIREEPEKQVRGSVNHTSAGAGYLMALMGGETNEKLRLFMEMISYVVSAHHGLYDAVDMDGKDKFSERLLKTDSMEQADLKEKMFSELGIDDAHLDRAVGAALQEFYRVFLRKYGDLEQGNRQEYLYYAGCFVRLLLSMQIDADWSDTAAAMDDMIQEEPLLPGDVYGEAWENYVRYMERLKEQAADRGSAEKEREINRCRDRILLECMEFTKHGSGIYCLPVPTGAGKTLASFGYALKFAVEHRGTEHEVERIFYISPYISITEQNANVIKEASGHPEWVLEHHSNVVNSDEKETVRRFETAWNERFVCTTMVQFLNTLFSDRKKSVRRFHKLKNAVVIIDEVQSLPVKTIHTFNLMMNFLHEICHTTIVLCTATQPALDAEYVKHKISYSNSGNMITNLPEIFRQFERTAIACEFSRRSEDFVSLSEKIKREFETVSHVLVIFNKKQTVSDFYDRMKQDLSDVEILYLTTNLCPCHRRKRISHIKEMLQKRDHKLLIISTNLIEAGVDISTDCVYRSLTGLESIAQAAGRCNRNGELACGKVVVFDLKEDMPGRNMDELSVARKKTREVEYAYQRNNGEESILSPEWIRKYYELLYQDLKRKMDFHLDKYKGEHIFGLLGQGIKGGDRNHILRQAFFTAGREYEVIADEGVTVLVPYEEGDRLIGELEAAEPGTAAYGVLRKLQQYTVSVYGYQKAELISGSVIRECTVLPGVYIAEDYDEEKGIVNELPDLFF